MRYKHWGGMVGDTRESTWFAILPVRIGDETRWMEWVTVRWRRAWVNDLLPPCEPRPRWVKESFL